MVMGETTKGSDLNRNGLLVLDTNASSYTLGICVFNVFLSCLALQYINFNIECDPFAKPFANSFEISSYE